MIKLVGTLPEKRVYWTLSDQLLRSATSIGANVIEAKAVSSRRDFIRSYEIALEPANETAYWLGLLREALGAAGMAMDSVLRETDENTRILAAGVLTMKDKR